MNEQQARDYVAAVYTMLHDLGRHIAVVHSMLPDSQTLWNTVNAVEELAASVDNTDPEIERIVRIAASAVDELRSEVGLFDSDVEDMIRGE